MTKQYFSITSLLRSTILFLSVLFTAILCSSGAMAYYIDSPYPNFRTYENGNQFYRASFAVYDDSNDRVHSDVVSSVAVANADTGEAMDMAFTHITRNRLWGWYDSGTASYVYDSGFSEIGFHRADTDTMPAGNYNLTAEFIDGTSETVAFSYGGLTPMPQIYASDFIQSFNDQGDLEFSWTPHDLSGLTDPYYRLSIGGFIDGRLDRDIMIRVGEGMNQVIIPKEVLDMLDGTDTITARFSLRTPGNRTYASDINVDYTPVPMPGSVFFLAAWLLGLTTLGRCKAKR